MNYDYAAFLAARRRPRPPYWYDPRLSQPAQPIVTVTWHSAVAYSTWLIGRPLDAGQLAHHHVVPLPSEIEWEMATNWDSIHQTQRRYPWGDTWDATRAITVASGTTFPLPISRRAGGASPYGAEDMPGNVWEWAASRSVSNLGSVAPFTESDRFMIRGGSCALRPIHLRCPYRCRLRHTPGAPIWTSESLWPRRCSSDHNRLSCAYPGATTAA
jgi:formylglycine-generating enzyme required for sulfatase activity